MDEEIKILCVDDEPNVLNAIKRLFMDEPYAILTAASGQEGLDILDREHAQIIISDYRMPGMNGVEFLKETYKRRPDAVRIVLSGYADTAAIVAAINEGQIYKFIPKPWNDDDLRVTISNAIERYFLYKKNSELTDELQRKNKELEELLAEKSAHLEFRSRILTAHQHMLDSMPVGILGVDFNCTAILCNSTWRDISENDCRFIGQSIKDLMPERLISFIEEIKKEGSKSGRMEINGIYGRLTGKLMSYEEQEGIILVFVREDNSL
jgi:two-component system NtrC family sensor kinase